MRTFTKFIVCGLIALGITSPVRAQFGPNVVSPQTAADRHVSFSIFAPKAESVQLMSGGDIPGIDWGHPAVMTRGTNGVWNITIGPLPPGAYRYSFSVDGLTVVDPRNPQTSRANLNTWSLVQVPGADWLDTRDVPHGAVSEITYWSASLKQFRQLHVYTPPGYEASRAKYPVLYLLHGIFDSDDSWTTVGRAGAIMDNLIAAGKARPMVVVMPNGHTGPYAFGAPISGPFEQEFNTDIKPQMEKRFRVYTDRKHRAIAGLSMGGMHTLNIAIPELNQFGYVGVFSSGVLGIVPGFGSDVAPPGPSFEEKNRAALDDAGLKRGLKLVWFATGKDDFLIGTTRATVDMLRKHGFEVTFQESAGGHTWDNWRDYLHEFAPLLFQ